MAIDDVARRATQTQASKARLLWDRLSVLEERMEALEGVYEESGEHSCDPDSRCRRAAWDCRG